jgi:hypothetical protein
MSVRFGSIFGVFGALTLVAVGAIYAASPPRVSNSSKVTEARTGANGTADDVVKAHPGPWGDLEWSSMYMEAPEAILDTLRKPDPNPHWIFPNATEASLRQLCAQADLPEDMQNRLFDPKRVLVQEGTMTLFPTIDDLEAMKPEARAVIYAELAKSPQNEYHHDPLIITGSFDDWLRDARLRPELQNDFRRLSYRSGRVLAFSDIRVLLNHATTDAEVEHVFKTITRIRTLVGTLKISPGSNAAQLVEYWTGNRASSDVLPILESVTERTGGATLDITHLLPPLARRRLYTYPTIDLLTRGRLPDCHWTSLNFFTAMPQDYYLDMRLAANRLLEKYNSVESPYIFGDMLCLLNSEGQAIHSCIYIADDVVFTKNGENSLKPWILMPLQDVKDIYSRDTTGVVKGFRRKQPSPV